jgi:DNA sulfur modification protein DndB
MCGIFAVFLKDQNSQSFPYLLNGLTILQHRGQDAAGIHTSDYRYKGTGKVEKDGLLARECWEAVAEHFPAWSKVKEGKIAASEIREGFIHSHGIALQAIGIAGHALLKKFPQGWKKKLNALSKIDWARTNAKLWEGRALIGGKVSKATTNIILTTNVIKKELGVELSPEEARVEAAWMKGRKT